MNNYELYVSDKTILDEYIKIPTFFEVKSIFEVGLKEKEDEYKIVERQIDTPYIKDYDEIKSDSLDPHAFIKQRDTIPWGFFLIYENEMPVAGAIAAYNTEWTNMLDGRDDLTVLWDIRVHPEYRGKGIGRKLIYSVIDWAKERNCTQIKIETQNVNVNACKFYRAMGAKLKGVNYHVYKGKEKDEIQFFWYMDL